MTTPKSQFCVRTIHPLLLVLSFLSTAPYVCSLLLLAPRVAQNGKCSAILAPQLPFSTSRILDGDSVGSELASSLAIIINSTSYFTTGILVSPSHVLFSASFVVDDDSIVIVGEQTNVSTTDGISISSFKPHPSFSATSYGIQYNIAYLTLSRPAPGKPVKVNSYGDFPQENAVVRLVGYGSTNMMREVESPHLNQVDVPLYKFSKCQYDIYIPSNWSSDMMFCAGYEDGSCSACYGDGAVIQYTLNDEPVLVGMHSGSFFCGNENSPAFYARVAAFADFLPVEVQFTTDVKQIEYVPSEQVSPSTSATSSAVYSKPAPNDPTFTEPVPSDPIFSEIAPSDLTSDGPIPVHSTPIPDISEFPVLAVVVGVTAGLIIPIAVVIRCMCCM